MRSFGITAVGAACVAGFLLSAAAASAQDDPATRRLLKLHDRISLLAHPRVQKEIKLSAEAAASVALLIDKAIEDWRPTSDRWRPDNQFGPLRAQTAEIERAVEEIATGEQLRRIDQLALHRWDVRALQFPDVQAELGLSVAQKAELARRADPASHHAEVAAIDRTLPKKQVAAEAMSAGDRYRAALLAVLDDGQRQKWNAMRGPEPLFPLHASESISAIARRAEAKAAAADAAKQRPLPVPSDHPALAILFAGVIEELGLKAKDAERLGKPRKALEAIRGIPDRDLEHGRKAMMKAASEALEKELGPAAFLRLKQLTWQAAGANAPLNPELGKILNVTPEQKQAAIRGVQEVGQRLRAAGKRPSGKQFVEQAHAAMAAALTDAQRKRWAELLGPPAPEAVLEAIRARRARD